MDELKTVPAQVTKLKTTELNGLLKFLAGSGKGYFELLAKNCHEASRTALAEREPQGNERDYFDWGYQKGLMKTHEMYMTLVTHVQNELQNRKREKEQKEESGGMTKEARIINRSI